MQNSEKQYLILAEQITFRNNKLTMINVWDHFTALSLPSKFNFDLVFACGPNWEPGEHELNFKVKSQTSEEFELGKIKVNLQSEKSVFNAMASNLNFMIEKNAGNLTFVVERNGEEIFSREYPVNYILDIKRKAKETASV